MATPFPHDGAWHEAVLSVRDLSKWKEALSALFGWQDVFRGPVSQAALRAWNLPDGARADEALMANPNDDVRRVRLIQFAGVPQVEIRSSGMAWDTGGIFSLLCFARDVDATFREAQVIGWSAFNDPDDMVFEGNTMRNVVLRAWDGINFGLYRPVIPAPATSPRYAKVAAPFNAQQMVRALSPARDFYAKQLGWTAWFDGTTRLKVNQFGMPANYAGWMTKNVAVMAASQKPDGQWVEGQVELVQWEGFGGRDFASRVAAPNLGILTLRIPVSDIAALVRQHRDRGAQIGPLKRHPIPPYGDATSFSVATPDGAIIEFFEIAP